MTSYHVDIVRCNNCNCDFIIRNVASCNTFGAKIYTDGSLKGPMYDESPALIACPECNKFFWQEDLLMLKSLNDLGSLDGPRRESLPAKPVYDSEYQEILNSGLCTNNNQERILRIKIWWSFNDNYRGDNATKEFIMPSEQENNLKKLLKFLDSSNPNDKIMKAEIFRQLGRFDECLEQLDHAYGDNFKSAIDTIKNLANAFSRKVGLIE